MRRLLLALAAAFLIASACDSGTLEPTTMATTVPTFALTQTQLPSAAPATIATPSPSTTLEPIGAAFARFENAVTLKIEGDFAVISGNTLPNHSSPYFPRTDPRYQQYNGSNPSYLQNPNVIYAQPLVFRIPLKPEKADVSQPTLLGPIGVSINGVPFFNQYAGPNRPLAFEINSFDQYNGHP